MKASEAGPVEVVEIGRAALVRMVDGDPAALNDVVMTTCGRLVRLIES